MTKKIVIAASIIASFCFVYFLVIPAFAGTFTIPPAVTFGPLVVRLYGIIMAASVLVGYLIGRKFCSRFGIKVDDWDNFAFWLVVVSFLCARLYFIIFTWKYFAQNPTETYKIWHGGLSIYGALFGGLLFTYLWTRKKTSAFAQVFDLLALAIPLSQALGRWGNFFNQEAFGMPTNLPWKMYVSPEFRPRALADFNYFHPAFLYESLCMIAVFFIIYKLMGKLRPGVLGLVYICLYSLVRFFIEPIRIDSFWIGNYRVDQVVAMAAALVAGIFIVYLQFSRDMAADQNPELGDGSSD
jgi:phosphatidylglycerol:prolipoprotein diacylglycerol transferase